MMEQQQGVHPSILNPIRRWHQQFGTGNDDERMSDDEEIREQQRRRLIIKYANNVDRQSVQHLVDFLRGGAHEALTELELFDFALSSLADGGLNVLRDYFINGSHFTKLCLRHCHFGSAHEAAQLISALQSNTTMTDLAIGHISNLTNDALGACLSTLLENNTHLQRLECRTFTVQGISARSLQPGLRQNMHLKELRLRLSIQNEGIRLIADALVVNTTSTLEVLDIGDNRINSAGLPHITRLVESTRLTKIDASFNPGMLDDGNATQAFANAMGRNKFLKALIIIMPPTPSLSVAYIFQALESNAILEELQLGYVVRPEEPCLDQLVVSLPRMKLRRLGFTNWNFLLQSAAFLRAFHHNTSLEDLSRGYYGPAIPLLYHFPQHLSTIMAMKSILTRNRSIRRANALLALQPRTRLPISSKSGTWAMAMAQLGTDRSGVSAIFHILQKRPALLERQLLRQQPQQQQQPPPPPLQEAARPGDPARVQRRLRDGSNVDDENDDLASSTARGERKRARPS